MEQEIDLVYLEALRTIAVITNIVRTNLTPNESYREKIFWINKAIADFHDYQETVWNKHITPFLYIPNGGYETEE